MLKQNILPSRQGELFKVNLLSNQSDGPYLKKDITLNNKRSLALLTGQGILQSITHYNNSMTMLQTKTRQISSLFPQSVQNVNCRISQCQQQLKLISQQSSKLHKQQQLLHMSLQQIFQSQKQQQQQLYHQCLPLLKGLLKTVKDSRTRQKETYHLMDRQGFMTNGRVLGEIAETKKVLVEGMLKCEGKIIQLEKVIGCRTHDDQGENEDRVEQMI